MNYNEMTTSDLIVVAHKESHPEDNPSAEHSALIDELVLRLNRLHVWRSEVVAAIDPHLQDEDGSDLIPDYARISNMLERITNDH
jgi:hypothetical protein